MVSPITKTDRCEMSTPSLPAASLSPHLRFPARRALLMASNYLIHFILWLISEAIFQARSQFLPALREGGAGGNLGDHGDRLPAETRQPSPHSSPCHSGQASCRLGKLCAALEGKAR